MQRLSRTKRDTIWTKTPSKPRREHTKVWHKKVVQIISKSKSTHELGEIKSTYDWFQNTSTHEVWYQKESNQHNKWSIRHQLKVRYQLKQKDIN